MKSFSVVLLFVPGATSFTGSIISRNPTSVSRPSGSHFSHDPHARFGDPDESQGLDGTRFGRGARPPPGHEEGGDRHDAAAVRVSAQDKGLNDAQAGGGRLGVDLGGGGDLTLGYGYDDEEEEEEEAAAVEEEAAAAEAARAAAMMEDTRDSFAVERDEALFARALRFYDPRFSAEREKCFLVGLELRSGRQAADFTLQESLNELSELCGTAGLEVCGASHQRLNERNPKTFIGSGKVGEVKREMARLGCCTVVLDDELSPGQQRNLEVAFNGGGSSAAYKKKGIKVIDRTALILDIFAQHALTREGQLQVELALTTYRLPRLTKLWTHLERQSGGAGGGSGGSVGLRGPGERQLEVDRREIRAKITSLTKQLDEVRKHRSIHRRRRRRNGLPVVALVGYTNAGKSTVLNLLSAATSLNPNQALAEDLLFATLDPTTRKCQLTVPFAAASENDDGGGAGGASAAAAGGGGASTGTHATGAPAAGAPPPPPPPSPTRPPSPSPRRPSRVWRSHPDVLMTDTVGFIQKLPTQLVAAFRATLEEVEGADLLVHVVDVSNPRLWRKQKQSVDATLEAMGMAAKPTVVLWNKADLATDLATGSATDLTTGSATGAKEGSGYVTLERLKAEAAKRPLTVAASAATGEGMDEFVEMLEGALRDALMEPVEVLLPYSNHHLPQPQQHGQATNPEAATGGAETAGAAAAGAAWGGSGSGGGGSGRRGSGRSGPTSLDLLSLCHSKGAVEHEEYTAAGVLVRAAVPRHLAMKLRPFSTARGPRARAGQGGEATEAEQRAEARELAAREAYHAAATARAQAALRQEHQEQEQHPKQQVEEEEEEKEAAPQRQRRQARPQRTQ